MTGERVKERLEIGGVARAHGIRGEVAIVTHDPDSVALETIKTIYIAGVEYHILEARSADKGWLVRLEGSHAHRGEGCEASLSRSIAPRSGSSRRGAAR